MGEVVVALIWKASYRDKQERKDMNAVLRMAIQILSCLSALSKFKWRLLSHFTA